VRDLLAFTRVSNVDDVIPDQVDAAAVLFKAIESLENFGLPDVGHIGLAAVLFKAIESLEGAIAESGARITAGPLPWVAMHGPHLQQVLQNLVSNAIKYRSPERAPLVHVSAEQQDACAIISVSDNGIGVAPEYQETIF